METIVYFLERCLLLKGFFKENSHASLARKNQHKKTHTDAQTRPLPQSIPSYYITYLLLLISLIFTTLSRLILRQSGIKPRMRGMEQEQGFPARRKRVAPRSDARSQKEPCLINNYSTILRFLQYNFRKSQIEQNPLLLFVYFYQKNIFFS